MHAENRRWPFCVRRDAIEQYLQLTNIGDPREAVDELLAMLLRRSEMRRSRSSLELPSRWRDTWLRAYGAVAVATDLGADASIDAVITASTEWQALIDAVGPERLTRAVRDEFANLMLDRERCQTPECHDLWHECERRKRAWLELARTEDGATTTPEPGEGSAGARPRDHEGSQPEGRERPDARALQRWLATKRAWASAWDSALPAL